MKNREKKILLIVIICFAVIGLGSFVGCETEATLDLPQQKTMGKETVQQSPTAPEVENKEEVSGELEGSATSNEDVSSDSETPLTTPSVVPVAWTSKLFTEQTPEVNLPTVSDETIQGMRQYDSRTEELVTSVKSQGNYSTCWAYATAAAIETAILKRELTTVEELDLSEVFLVYYRYNAVPTPIGGLYSDNREDFSPNIFKTGDFPENLINPLCAWAGVVNEWPERKITETNFRDIDRTETYKNQVALVTSAGIITTHANCWTVHDTSKVDEGVLAMKMAIYTYGALATGYNMNKSTPYAGDYKNYGSYTAENSGSVNHAITIVGWDDNFSSWDPAEPYTAYIRPPKPGAWLVKNSYGDDFGNGGYFWLSYYDSTIASWAFYCDVESIRTYDNNYQYDSASKGDEIIGGISSPILQTANIFTVQGDEDLKAVQLGMHYNNMKYKIDVYLNPDKNYPTSGEHMTSIQGSVLPSGRHTVKLSTLIQLKAGDTFSVVVTYESTLPDQTPTAVYESTANSLAGQSFYRQGTSGDWRDMYYEGKGNLRLKAFTKNR